MGSCVLYKSFGNNTTKVWLIAANSITYYVFIILEISRNGMKKYRSGRRSGEKITAVVVNSTWVIGFFIVSVLDGLSKNWPRPATQWYMWTTYSMYGLVMVTTAARSFLRVLDDIMQSPHGVRLDDVHSRRENQPNVHNNNLEFKIEVEETPTDTFQQTVRIDLQCCQRDVSNNIINTIVGSKREINRYGYKVDQRRFYDARYRLDEKFTKASTYRSTHVVSNLFRKGAKGELEYAPNSSGVRATGTTTTNEQLGGQRRRRGRRGAILVGSTRNSTATFHAKMTSAMKLFAYPLGIGLAMVGILSLLLGVVFSMPESSFTHSIEAQIIMSSLYLVIPIIIGMTLVVGMVMGPVRQKFFVVFLAA
eukprot:jgi/Bigna1/129349/aug1.8_g4057